MTVNESWDEDEDDENCGGRLLRSRTRRRRPSNQLPESGYGAYTHPYEFTAPNGDVCVVSHSGVPYLLAWVKVIGCMFDSAQERWAAARDLFEIEEPSELHRKQQRASYRLTAAIKSVVWTRKLEHAMLAPGSIIVTERQLHRLAREGRRVGNAEMKETAEWMADAAGAAVPVSKGAARDTASRTNHLRPHSRFPRRNFQRTMQLRDMNVAGNQDFLTGVPTHRDVRVRSRLHTIGNSRFTPEECVHLSCITAPDPKSVNIALRDVLVGVVEPVATKVQRVGDHFVAAIGFASMVERDKAAAVFKSYTTARDDPSDIDDRTAVSEDDVDSGEPGSDDSEFDADGIAWAADLFDSYKNGNSLGDGGPDQGGLTDEEPGAAPGVGDPGEDDPEDGIVDVRLCGQTTARPATKVTVADCVSLYDVIPILLIEASATRGSQMKPRIEKLESEKESKRHGTTVPHFDTGGVYFIDAAQGMTQAQFWITSRKLYPETGVSRAHAVISASGKEGALMKHSFLQLFLGELVDLGRSSHLFYFMYNGRPATASVRVIGPANDHYAGFQMNGVMGGCSRARSQQDMADALMFGVKADQGPVDVTLGGVERMREDYRGFMARQAGEYRQREIDDLEQSAFTAQMLAAAEIGSKIYKKMKLWSPTYRPEFQDYVVAPASLHCVNEMGINLFQFHDVLLPATSSVRRAFGELIMGDREVVIEAALGDGKCVQTGAMVRRLVVTNALPYTAEARDHLRDKDHRVCALLPILTARLQRAIYTDRASKSVLELLVTSRLVFVLTAWLSATVGGKGKPADFGKPEWHSGIKWHTGNLYYHTMATVMWRTKLKLMLMGFDLAQHIDEWGEMHLAQHVLHAQTLHQRCYIDGERIVGILKAQSEPYVPNRRAGSGYKEISVDLPCHDIVICSCMMHTHPTVQRPNKQKDKQHKRPAGPTGSFNRRANGERELPIGSTELRDLYRKIPDEDAHNVWSLRTSAVLIGVSSRPSQLRVRVEAGGYPDSAYLENPTDLLVVCACGSHTLQPVDGINRDLRLSTIRESYFRVQPNVWARAPNRYPVLESSAHQCQAEFRFRLLHARRFYQRMRLIRTRGPDSAVGRKWHTARLAGLEEVCDFIKTKQNTKHTRFKLLQSHLKLERARSIRGLPPPPPIPRAWWLRAPRVVRDSVRARRPMVDQGFCSHHSCVKLGCIRCVCVRAGRACGPRCHKASEGMCGNSHGCSGGGEVVL